MIRDRIISGIWSERTKAKLRDPADLYLNIIIRICKITKSQKHAHKTKEGVDKYTRIKRMCTTERRMNTCDEIKMNAGDVAITKWTEQDQQKDRHGEIVGKLDI